MTYSIQATILWVSFIAIVVVVTGCDEAESARTLLNHVAPTVVDDHETVDEDQWYYYAFTIDNEDGDGGMVKISGRHMSGPALDFVFMDKANYDTFDAVARGQTNGDWRYFGSLSSRNLTGSFDTDWQYVANGTYVLVVDNSDMFDAQPPWNGANDQARYSVTIRSTNVATQ